MSTSRVRRFPLVSENTGFRHGNHVTRDAVTRDRDPIGLELDTIDEVRHWNRRGASYENTENKQLFFIVFKPSYTGILQYVLNTSLLARIPVHRGACIVTRTPEPAGVKFPSV